MSVHVMNLVWKRSAQKGSDLLLLLAIADNANDAGEAWPGVPTLAKKIRMSARQVQRMLPKLRASGELDYEEGTGRGHTHTFYINLSKLEGRQVDTLPSDKARQDVTHYRTERVTSENRKGDILVAKGDTAMSPEPSVEPSREEPSGSLPSATPTAEAAADAPRPKGEKKSKEQKRSKADPRSSHPAIQLCREIASQFPPIEIYDDIIRALGGEPNVEKLTECRKAWVLAGKNRNGWGWATEWYVSGIPEWHRQKSGVASPAPTQPAKPDLSPEEVEITIQAVTSMLEDGRDMADIEAQLAPSMKPYDWLRVKSVAFARCPPPERPPGPAPPQHANVIQLAGKMSMPRG